MPTLTRDEIVAARRRRASEPTPPPAGTAIQGPPGPQGPPGDPGGPAGPAGPRGFTGAAGANGADGLPGIRGTDGVDGAPGAVGPQGPAGAAGAVGPQGPAGAAGAAGAQGIQGIQGIQGPAGAAGADGTALPVATTAAAGKVKADNNSAGDPVALTSAGHGAAAAPHSGHALTVHSHAQADVTGLVAALAAKLSATDPSVTNARTPTAHAASHATGGTDAITPAAIGAAVAGAAPAAHAATHNAGGTDALAIDAAAATGSLRTLGSGAAQAAQGSVDAAHNAAAAPHTGHALSVHTHAESDITGLVADLAAKAPLAVTGKAVADQTTIGTVATTVTGLTLALAAATRYRFRIFVVYVCTATAATLAARVKYSGTLGATTQSTFKVKGSSGAPTVWAAAYRELTGAINAAIATAVGGPGASGTAASLCVLEITGEILTGTAGNLDVEIIGSAATSITPKAGSVSEAVVIP